MRMATLVAAVGTSMLALGCGKNAPSHRCDIRGKVVLADGSKGDRCTMDMYTGKRTERLMFFPVEAGKEFSVSVSFPILDPGGDWHAVFRCEGYAPRATAQFGLGAGWLSCRAVDLGSTELQRDGNDAG